MQLFIAVLTDGTLVPTILQKFADNKFHGSVLSTKSIKHALMDSVEPEPYFGGLNMVIDSDTEENRPMIFVVCKDEEVKVLSGLVKEVCKELEGKGFMYSLPISYIEGLDY